MAKVWVQLYSVKHVEKQGRMHTYHKGDWVQVGKQTARLWISEGSAWIPEGEAVDLTGSDCGVFVRGSEKHGQEALGDYVGQIDIVYQTSLPERPPWSRTLIYNPALKLRKELVPVGFNLLDTWQLAVPLWDYDKLAIQHGEPGDFERTKKLVRDLRIPLYDANLVFVRRCGDINKFLGAWREEEQFGGDPRHAILRAIYRVKPLILPLPTTWCGKDRGL